MQNKHYLFNTNTTILCMSHLEKVKIIFSHCTKLESVSQRNLTHNIGQVVLPAIDVTDASMRRNYRAPFNIVTAQFRRRGREIDVFTLLIISLQPETFFGRAIVVGQNGS